MQEAQPQYIALLKDKISHNFVWAHWSHVHLHWLRIYLYKFILLSNSITNSRAYILLQEMVPLIPQKIHIPLVKNFCSFCQQLHKPLNRQKILTGLSKKNRVHRTLLKIWLYIAMIFFLLPSLLFTISPMWEIRGCCRHCSKHN